MQKLSSFTADFSCFLVSCQLVDGQEIGFSIKLPSCMEPARKVGFEMDAVETAGDVEETEETEEAEAKDAMEDGGGDTDSCRPCGSCMSCITTVSPLLASISTPTPLLNISSVSCLERSRTRLPSTEDSERSENDCSGFDWRKMV